MVGHRSVRPRLLDLVVADNALTEIRLRSPTLSSAFVVLCGDRIELDGHARAARTESVISEWLTRCETDLRVQRASRCERVHGSGL